MYLLFEQLHKNLELVTLKNSILDTFCVTLKVTVGAGGKVRFLYADGFAILGGAARQVERAVELVQPQEFVLF